MRNRILIGGLVLLGGAVAAQQAINPRQQPGAMVHIFAPEQHDLYDGHFVISANRIYMVGGLNDPEGWDHLDNEAKNESAVAIAWTESLFAQPGDVLGRRTPKEARVLPTELGRTQIADAPARIARVHSLKQHQTPSLVQSKDLLVLQRAHRGHGFEPLMERRCAHVDGGGHLVDCDRLGEMRAYPGRRFGNPLHARLRLSDLGDSPPNRRPQQTKQDLVDDQRSEKIRPLL